MSQSLVRKASAVLVGLSILATGISPAIALDSTASAPIKSGPAVRPVLKKEATQKIETRREDVEAKVAAARDKIASRAAALKTRLQAFKDQKKAQITERVNTNLNNINQSQTTKMQKHLDKMSEILNKLEARVNQNKPDIKDPAKAEEAIASARATIATASAAVSAQALKDYTISVSSESRVRLDAKLQRDKMHTDLRTVRKAVIDAKQAVANAIRVAKSGKVEIPGIGKEGTESGQQ
ncbi:hypothetical protein HYU45_03515 [Candidatus Daviesbacteria bacterium]|nr:hypothetical protein [Candidatus Daviesbacteria bacterium]